MNARFFFEYSQKILAASGSSVAEAQRGREISSCITWKSLLIPCVSAFQHRIFKSNNYQNTDKHLYTPQKQEFVYKKSIEKILLCEQCERKFHVKNIKDSMLAAQPSESPSATHQD
ncbi:hypothetical protein CSA56_03380 [candidate division KSB3 bacterium]|uniref:Uncharacterized protein n=1 Tax=candidate division KSB3 bacterium TaxID=2044937 RepID=A0A2G6KJT7_9BACT|nr:MAG: hypothetical protein CSA56_03380 [candidate division KSB3 bacterium]